MNGNRILGFVGICVLATLCVGVGYELAVVRQYYYCLEGWYAGEEGLPLESRLPDNWPGLASCRFRAALVFGEWSANVLPDTPPMPQHYACPGELWCMIPSYERWVMAADGGS